MTVLLYSIIRFRPFIETGEFANVGVVACDKALGTITYKLTNRKVRRINQFFNDLDPRLFSTAITLLGKEIDRLTKSGGGVSDFQYLTKRRESVLVFSEARALETENSVEDEVLRLYDRYVKRTFATEEYRETILTREIRARLQSSNIAGYGRYRVEDDILPLTFDIASTVGGLRVIKPLAFPHKNTVGILDHGATWAQRFRHLIRAGKLDTDRVLVPIDQATDPMEPFAIEAREEAVSSIRQTGVQLVNADDTSAIIAFTRPGARPESRSLY